MPDDPQPQPSRAGSLPLIGGVLALDLCNTCSGRSTEKCVEHLHTAADVITWSRHAAILDAEREAHLRALCGSDAALAESLVSRTIALRDAIYAVHAALAHGLVADQAAIDTIAAAHAACLSKGRLTPRDDAFGWTWDIAATPQEAVLGPIAASAMMLITASDHARLKQCDGHHCGWLFLDVTKSNNRRWCEMEVCGNRAKQRRRRRL